MTIFGLAGAHAGEEKTRSATARRWGGRAAILAGASLAALALGAAPAMAACDVNGNTTTCTGANPGQIYTTTPNVIINNLTANLGSPSTFASAIYLDGVANATVNLGAFSASSLSSPTILLVGGATPLTATIQGNVNAAGPSTGTTTNGTSPQGIVVLPTVSGGSLNVTLTHTGNVTVNGSRPAGTAQWGHSGITAFVGNDASSRSSITHTGNISITSTGAAGNNAMGIGSAAGGGVTIRNTGNIAVTSESTGAHGLVGESALGAVSITNSGNISVTGNGFLVNGINGNAAGASGSVSVTSVGNITTNNASSTSFGQAINVAGADITINSTGNLTSLGSIYGHGIQVAGPLSTNNSTTPPSLVASSATRARVTSTGNITTVGRFSPGIAARAIDGAVSSTGTIETSGEGSAGIVVGGFYAEDPLIAGTGQAPVTYGAPNGPASHAPAGSVGVINNNGNIVTRGTTSVGLLATSETSRITSSGAITTQGASSPAIAAFGQDLTVTGSGAIATNGEFGILLAGPSNNPNNYGNVTGPATRASVDWTGNINTGSGFGVRASPIRVLARDVTVRVAGNITADGQAVATGAGTLAGINVDAQNSVAVTNIGNIAINIASGTSAGLMVANTGPGGASLTHTGDISMTAQSGNAWAINVNATGGGAASVTSTGNLTVHRPQADGAAGFGAGITVASPDVTVSSTGNIVTTGPGFSPGITTVGSVAFNPDAGAFIILPSDVARITSTGNISTQGVDSSGVVTVANQATVNVSGSITTTGQDATGIETVGNGLHTVNVSGTINAFDNAIEVSAGGGSVINVAAGSEIRSQNGADIALSNAAFTTAGIAGVNANAPITVVNRGRLAGARAYISAREWTGPEELVNFGVITGGVAMNWNQAQGVNTSAPGRFVNAPGGHFSGSSAFVSTILNAGVFSPGGDAAVGVMNLTGNFSQVSGVSITGGPANGLLANGRYLVNVDFTNMTADRIDVAGSAALGGEVVIAPLNFSPATLKPGTSTMRIVNATGGVSNLGLTVADSLLIDYGLNFTTNAVDLTANVDFTPAGVTERAGAVSNALGQFAAAGGAVDPFVSQVLTSLLTAGTAVEVEAIVRQLSPDSLEAQGGQAAPGVALLAGGMFSCGEREGDFRFAAEGECGWVRIGTRVFNQDATSDMMMFDEHATSLMGGVQKAVSENWRLGFSAGIEQGDIDVPGFARSNSTRYQFGVVGKGQYGPIGTYVAATAGWSEGETQRFVPVVNGIAQSEQNATFYGVHGRLSYTYMLGQNAYLRPQARVDAVHVSLDDFAEAGIGGLGLAVAGRDDWTVSFSPSVEFGGESREGGNLFRPWLRAGVTLLDDYMSTTTANFAGAPAGAPAFVTTSAGDDLFADFGAGLNILTQDYEFRLSYEGRISNRTDAHDLALKFIRRF